MKSVYPVGSVFEVSYPMFKATLSIEEADRLNFEIKDGPFARKESVAFDVADLGNNLFAVNWVERDGSTVVNIQDFDSLMVHSFATLPDGKFLRNQGTIAIRQGAAAVSDRSPKRNALLVLNTMTSLFQRREASAVDRLYSEDYIQHNQDMPQGRAALKKIVEGLDESVYYEPGMIIAQGDKVAIHGRIRGWGPKPQVVVDIFRIENGKLAEHWDVLQSEHSGGKFPMFDPGESQ